VDTAQADLDIITGADGVNLLSATQTQVNDIEADATAILADTDDIGVAGAGLTEAGGTGDQLTAVPWNAAWDAEVESEVEDAVGADVTAVLADTGELQGDWANGGRLDLLLDAIPTQVLGLPTSTAATNIPVWGFDSDNDPVTGVSDWACVISRDGGAASPVTDTTEAEVDAGDIPGYYVVDLTQVETNGSAAVLYCTGTGVVPWILNIEFRE
jgi:hypothetical protein